MIDPEEIRQRNKQRRASGEQSPAMRAAADDIDALISEVERLRAEIERATSATDGKRVRLKWSTL